MIIYGNKPIELKSINIPHSCSNCGHKQQIIHIYRNFFSIFYIPIVPLRKNAFVSCPNCGKEQKKKEFLKELISDGKDATEAKAHLQVIIKDAKAPLYTYITSVLALTLIFGFVAYSLYETRQSANYAASYADNPRENVLVVFKDDDDAYPYRIMYIPQIINNEVVIFEWKYSYQNLRDARIDILKVRQSLSANAFKKNFSEQAVVPIDEFLNLNFAHIHSLSRIIDWKKLIE